MEIKVLGPGCPRCKQTEEIVKQAVAEAGVEADVQKVTDTMEIAAAGVFGTPAVIIDGEVKLVGKVPSKDQVKSWLGGQIGHRGPRAPGSARRGGINQVSR